MSDTLTLIDANGNPVTVAANGLSPERRAMELAKAGGFNIPAGVGPSLGQQALDGSGAYGHSVSPAVANTFADAQAAGFQMPEANAPVYGTGDTWTQAAPAMSRIARPDLFGGQVPRGVPAYAPEAAAAAQSSSAPSPSPEAPQPPSGPSGGPMGAAQAAFTGSFPARPNGNVPGIGGNGLAKAYDQEAAAQKKAAQAAQERVQAEISAAQQAAEFKQRQAEEAQANEQTRQTAVADGQKKYEQAWADFQKPDAKVDPNRYWSNKSTGQKVLAGVAVFLSGLGNGLMGKSGNDALNIIQKQIDEDIGAQKDNIANDRNRKSGNLNAASNAFSMMRQRFGDDRAAEAATRAMQWDAVADTIRSKTLQSQSAEVRANGELALAGVAEKKAMALNDLANRNAQIALEQRKLGLNETELGLKFAAEAAKAKGVDPETYVPGYGQALGKDAAKEARSMVASHNETSGVLNDLIAMRQKYGGETFNREAVAKMKTLATKLVGALNRSERFGALDKGTQELLTDMIGGDPTAYGQKSLAALMQVRASLGKDLEGKLQPYLNPARREKNANFYEGRMTSE